jgi:hypothetical protein
MSESSDYILRSAAAKKIGELIRGKPFNERALIEWERDGKGPPVTRVGRAVTYYWPSVLRWIREQEQPPRKSRAA